MHNNNPAFPAAFSPCIADFYMCLSECYEDIHNHIFFAGNGCGDYYCYNVSVDGIVEEENIYIWEHEDNVCRLVAKNIEEMIRRYINDEI